MGQGYALLVGLGEAQQLNAIFCYRQKLSVQKRQLSQVAFLHTAAFRTYGIQMLVCTVSTIITPLPNPNAVAPIQIIHCACGL